MNLKETLDSERVKTGKKALKRAYTNYTLNRGKALKKVDEKSLKEQLKRIKKYSISNLDILKEKTIKNLKEQKIKVFEAKNAKEACKIALKLMSKKETIVKSKSNTIEEIGLKEKLKGRNKVIETDCGDFLVQLCDDEASHPVTPALHIPIEKITKKIKEKYKEKVKNDPEKVTEWVMKFLRKKILNSKIGLTGANIISSDGAIFILENEGNISLITRIPEKHIIIAGIDKIVPTYNDAMTICQACAIWGTGATMPTYINVITSPSKTADVQKKLVYGAQGTKEVYLILVDNGRTEMIEQGFDELLHCINCGSCLYFCPVYRQMFDKYGFHYIGGRGVGMTMFQEGEKKAFDRGLYFCTTCELCKKNCPLEIDVPKIVRKLRKRAIEKGLETPVNEKMMENIRSMGNPFGEEAKKGKVPKELFCC
jgi:iron-sulfur cluster protein